MLGPRVLKTGIAVTLALYICSMLDLEPALFAGVAAIFTIQPSIYRSWKQVLDQVMTNTLGAIIALFAINYLGNHPITIGIVMIVVIMISLKFKIENTIPLTLVTVLAIMSAPEFEDWFFAFNRFVIILIGMGSAFIVNLIILPPKYKNNFLDKSKSAFQNISLLLRTAISNEMTEKSFQDQLEKVNSDLKKLEELYLLLDEEREKMAKVNPLNIREIVIFKQMIKSLKQGQEVLEVIENHFFQSKATEREIEIFDKQLEHLIKCHEYFLLKFENKIKMNEKRIEDNILKDSELFLEEVIDVYKNNQEDKLRLVIIGSSIFEYAFQLQRLNQLIENYIKKVK